MIVVLQGVVGKGQSLAEIANEQTTGKLQWIFMRITKIMINFELCQLKASSVQYFVPISLQILSMPRAVTWISTINTCSTVNNTAFEA